MHEVSRSRIVKSVCSILHSGSHSIFPYRFGIDETDEDEQVEAFQSKFDDHPSISLNTHSFDWIEIQEAHCNFSIMASIGGYRFQRPAATC